MDNLILWRLSIIPTTMAACFICFLAYRDLSVPFNFAVIAVCVGAIAGHAFYLQRKEKAARFDAFYAAATNFGKPGSFDNHFASFEREGTMFECEFPRDEHNTTFEVRFYLPKIYQRFVIQHNSLFKKSFPDCEPLQHPALDGVLLASRNPDFLFKLLKNRNLASEIYNYPEKMLSRFWIVFDDGNFEISWTPNASDQIDGFYQICQTAVVFHDALKKLRG